ncbi:MAG: rhodanese-like domain-containing protein [Alphaproteobacteria bacterium]|nr:rhodanese-like domain-containing protein [Alphaproteobacteria bacterium]MCB9695875.1 rhodanese-like domain-containing protein [Alphaproteobacteria bacterium]
MRFKDLGPREVHAQLGRYATIVDVRQPDELLGDLGYIEGAVNIPLGLVPNEAHTLDRTKPVLVVCRSGGRSAAGANHLAMLGFEDVTNLEGGMLAWAQLRLPVARRVAS